MSALGCRAMKVICGPNAPGHMNFLNVCSAAGAVVDITAAHRHYRPAAGVHVFTRKRPSICMRGTASVSARLLVARVLYAFAENPRNVKLHNGLNEMDAKDFWTSCPDMRHYFSNKPH